MTELNMDFSYDEQQEAVRDAAVALFERHCPDDRVVETEINGSAYDDVLWRELITSGLLDAVLPEEVGGGGLGMVGLTIILEQQGRHVARVPLVSTAVAALAVTEAGGVGHDLLAAIQSGTARVAIAMPELWSAVTATSDGESWVLRGSLPQVYLAGSCTHLLVVAASEDGERVFLVDLQREGIKAEPFAGMSRNHHAAIDFMDVQVAASDVLGDESTGEWVRHRFQTGLAAIETGLCREAIRRAAIYTSDRTQFGRPLSTNQGVALRAADAFIDAEAMRLTMLDAAWQLDQGVDATKAVLIASWWAREGGFRVVHATQHLHGGAGADLDNHIHRFFLWARELDIVGAPAPVHLTQLGDLLDKDGNNE